ncbi:PspA [Myxococcus xanthus]|uniref:PspA n=1 Tax=Myxococcus xanthus TaxID=34 RepID=A0A7Y4MS97_MYXXA|nr:PspA [Myxococcus xanthus]NOJ80414.1 PspA [Myxococcus xanthus]NOJ84947.1 PspA [Myxococcus xanthus]
MQNDMKSTIQAAVAEEVGKAMGRQLDLLEKIAQFLGIELGANPTSSALKRPPVPPPSSKRPPAPATGPAPKRPSSVRVRKWVKPKQEAAPQPTRAGPAPQKSRGRPRAAARTAKAAAPSPNPEASVSFEVGQEVRYKQGRGAFTAKVKAVDEKAKTVTVERVSDGKQVMRPFDKVTPA